MQAVSGDTLAMTDLPGLARMGVSQVLEKVRLLLLLRSTD